MRRRSALSGLIASLGWIGSARALTPMQLAVLNRPSTGPSLDLNFINGSPFDSRIGFTRPSPGTYFDATGTLQTAANDIPRIDYGPTPGGITNWIRNSTMVGAAVGTPGVTPTNWVIGQTQVTGVGVESGTGIPYIEVRFSSSSAALGNANTFDLAAATQAAPGQPWTVSMYLSLVAGSLAGVTLQPTTRYYSAGPTFLTQLLTVNPVPVAGNMQRVSSSDTAPATTQFAQGALRFVSTGAYDFTLRIGAPQLEQGGVANAWVPTSGAAANVGAIPRGLLIEEQRTNSVRNPRAEGAVAGGASPTNWSIQAAAGLTSTIIGTGSEAGIPFVDVRFAGTTTANLSQILPEGTTTTTVAANGQTWAYSLFTRLVGGTLAGVVSITMAISERGPGGASIVDLGTTVYTPATTAAPLANQRITSVATMNDATTAFVMPRTSINHTVGIATDFTLRIGAPQLELGAFATSLILPAVGAPAASTRMADKALLPASTWFSATHGTLDIEAMMPTLPPATALTARFISLDDGTANNRVALVTTPGSILVTLFEQSNGVLVQPSPAGALTGGAAFKLATTYDGRNAAVILNGGAISSLPNAAPIGVNGLSIGYARNLSSQINGYIRRVRYWPRALNNNELVRATT